MEVRPDFGKPCFGEERVVAKMKSAFALQECLHYLADQASAEEFHRATALIKSAIEALDDELSYSIRIDSATGKVANDLLPTGSLG